jgi:hypothetical protein
MGGRFPARAGLALAWGAPIFLAACSAGPISVGDDRVPRDPSDAGGSPGAFGDLCAFSRAVLVEDSAVEDTQVSQQVLSALQTACGAAMATRQVSQTTPGILATDGRPLWDPAELGMLTGGPWIHDAVRYLDSNVANVYVQASTDDYVWGERTTSAIVFSMPRSESSTTHDIGIMQVIREPIGGTISLSVYGHQFQGTQAAAHYFINAIAPNLKSDRRRYYVVEWTDQDGDETPTSGDLFVLRVSG